MTAISSVRLIERDEFAFEFLSRVGQRESWRKEVHRPIYHVHKWWAKRLGSVFRGILLGSALPEGADLEEEFYRQHRFDGSVVFDPFLGSGTTVGEAHKLGFTALGRDINPVAVSAVQVALGPIDSVALERAFRMLAEGVGRKVRELYRTVDRQGAEAEVLYFFWVMMVECPKCAATVDLFPRYDFARNAYPARKPEVQIVCPSCGDIFQGLHGATDVRCDCGTRFNPSAGTSSGVHATCQGCSAKFAIKEAIGGERPHFRMYAKMVLCRDGRKQYVRATREDCAAYDRATRQFEDSGLGAPTLALADGFNTRQAMQYGFTRWSDFFNARQLLALRTIQEAVRDVGDPRVREALLVLFSGVLEFNNMFASFKGEGTGAVRHMFSHHILKPERTPIEANVWGTAKSSGSFAGLYRSRLLRAFDYRLRPTEVDIRGEGGATVCSPPFGQRLAEWQLPLPTRALAISCGDSANTGLPSASVDLIVTDPPFFDNVHYSELADFFQAWRSVSVASESTRSSQEVQDPDAARFTEKLRGVFAECRRVLRDDGLLVFSYHHSREEGWTSVAKAILDAGFVVVNAHPVRAEMSVATPKAQAKEPIQLDVILVCRKRECAPEAQASVAAEAAAERKIGRLENAGFALSKGDKRVIRFGQHLCTLRSMDDDAMAAFPTDRRVAERV